MENTKIEKSDMIVAVMDLVDGSVLWSLVGGAVMCLMPRSSKKIIDLTLQVAFAVFGSKLAGLAWDAIEGKVHEINENIVDSVGDFVDNFKAIRAQKKEA